MLCSASHSPPLRTVTRECAPCHAKIVDWYLIQTVAIRALNDELRTRFRGGTVSVSENVRELGHIVVAHAFLMMAETTQFDNEEHQAGRFVFCARVFRWTISYGDSPNPANAKITKRELHLTL